MKMDIFGNSDAETFSETSSDDQDDIFSMYSGHARSILSSLEDSIGKIDDFLSFERGFMHGDIVCASTNPSGQLGKIEKVKMYVDLENVSGKLLKDINSEKLSRIRSILVGDYVIHGPWVGRVEKVVENVGILFDNGITCQIMATDQFKLFPLSPNLLDDSLYPYHPGQRVRLGQPNESKPSRWLYGTSKTIQNEGTIFSVEVGLVYVEWISPAIVGFELTISPPPCMHSPKNLTLLSCFENTNWQLGDWCILTLPDRIRENVAPNLDETFSIVKRKIKVDVMWQDGTYTLDLDSQAVFPVSVVNAHDFFPKQFVMEKISTDELSAFNGGKWGIVNFVDANERTVEVKWENEDETVSAYELVEHPDFSYNIGDIVFKSNKIDFVDYSAYMSEAHKKSFLSCIGNVVGFGDGKVEVQWANGITAHVAPSMILHMEKEDVSVATQVPQDENDTEFRNEVAHYEKQSLVPQVLSEITGTTVMDCQNNQTSRLYTFSQAAVGFFTNVAANFFTSNGTTSSPLQSECAHATAEAKPGQLDRQDMLKSCDMLADEDFDADVAMNFEKKINETNKMTGLMRSVENSGMGQFKQFDVVGDCSDHHFIDGEAKGTILSQMRRGWLKKVQQEWSILEKDLPETIYVRIYEERMDLVRAAIVGASGTPYHDGLFFFDLFLPPDYPQVPPLVFYYSGGLRLNPNLYESGKVCLSLLNTWNGTGTEKWNPGSSTILQVLLSLQALVLNEKPYFNEAGYDDQIGRAEGEKNSMSYNENAYLGTCKCMLYQLRKPLKHFEALVEQHFERRAQSILSACKANMEGAKNTKGNSNSTGFKIMLAKLYPKLLEAFSDKGIDCSPFCEPKK